MYVLEKVKIHVYPNHSVGAHITFQNRCISDVFTMCRFMLYLCVCVFLERSQPPFEYLVFEDQLECSKHIR